MRKKEITEQRDEAKKLARELMPYLMDYIHYGLELGKMKPEGHNEDDCFDCEWNRRAIAWQARIDSGEIYRIIGNDETDD